MTDAGEEWARRLLRAMNRVHAKGREVRVVFPQAPEVADELGLVPTDVRLVSATEYLRRRGYLAPAEVAGLTAGAYTITPAGFEWLEAGSEPPSDPRRSRGAERRRS